MQASARPVAGLAGATAAFAGENGWYVFGAAGQITGNNDQPTLDNALRAVGATGFSSSLSNPTVYNLDVGYQVNKNFAMNRSTRKRINKPDQ